MLHNRDIQRFSGLLSGLAQKMSVCEEVASVLIETGQQWRNSSEFLMVFFGTDYGRQRQRVREDCYAAISLARKVRRATPCVDAIRATAHLKWIVKSCNECPSTNQANLEADRPFACLARSGAQTADPRVFRFSMDKEGRILDRQ